MSFLGIMNNHFRELKFVCKKSKNSKRMGVWGTRWEAIRVYPRFFSRRLVCRFILCVSFCNFIWQINSDVYPHRDLVFSLFKIVELLECKLWKLLVSFFTQYCSFFSFCEGINIFYNSVFFKDARSVYCILVVF